MKQCRLVCALALFSLAMGLDSLASTIRVPQDQPTIQAGINAANNGDTVLVAPGTYYEQINFSSKNIVVESQSGAGATTIDASRGTGPVVRFISGEGLQAVLRGFTIQNGSECCFPYEGGGIEINNASPTIIRNVIRDNVCTDSGGGINVYFGSPLISANAVVENRCANGGDGGGISLDGDGSAQVVHNQIAGNLSIDGGGLSINGGGSSLIFDNQIVNNSGLIQGGGIYLVNESGITIAQNLIADNWSNSGTQIYIMTPANSAGFKLVDNTIASSRSAWAPHAADAAVLSDGSNAAAEIANNIIVANFEQAALLCNPIYHFGPPIVQSNDAFDPRGTAYSDSCSGMEGTAGNISADPLFGGSAQLYYELQVGSPAINAGDNLPGLPAKDLASNPRIVGGIVDMGAYEYQGSKGR